MGGLEKLIQELCPDGVEYRPLGDFAHYSVERIDAADVDAENYVGVDNLLPDKQGKTASGYVPEEGKVIAFHEGDILIGNIRPYLKKIWRATHDGGTNGDVLVICSDNTIDPEYLFYCLSSDLFFYYDMQHAKGAKMPRGDKGAIMQFEVPVPPMEVQREIVRVLDHFTLLRQELADQLSAELSARRKQYEYYKTQLFNVEKCKYRKIGSFTKVFSASRVHRSDWKSEGVPFWRSSDLISYYNGVENSRGKAYISYELYEALSSKSGKIHKDDILVTGGGTIGIPYVVPNDDPLYVKDADLLCIQKNDTMLTKYLYHYFLSEEFRRYLSDITHDATIAHYTISQILETPVPVPEIEEQRRIVALLDTFESLFTGISFGLPAEIEARTKQYEYFRDKLLSFPRKETA